MGRNGALDNLSAGAFLWPLHLFFVFFKVTEFLSLNRRIYHCRERFTKSTPGRGRYGVSPEKERNTNIST